MKMFNKVLAVILSLVMLLSVVPAVAFAAEPGIPTTENGGSKPSVSTAKGTGADGTVTLTLIASDLVDAITGDIKQKHVIDQTKCIKCGQCIDNCPKKAIVKG